MKDCKLITQNIDYMNTHPTHMQVGGQGLWPMIVLGVGICFYCCCSCCMHVVWVVVVVVVVVCMFFVCVVVVACVVFGCLCVFGVIFLFPK